MRRPPKEQCIWIMFQCFLLMFVHHSYSKGITLLDVLQENRLIAFGSSVSTSGDTIVVGANFEYSNATGIDGDETNNYAPASGAAYVYVRDGTTWTQQAYLKASNTGADDWFHTVSISGDTIVVGATHESSNAIGVNGDQNNDDAPQSGAAYVFVRDGTTWTQQAYLKASNTKAWVWFGSSVSISGDTIVVGSRFEPSNAVGVNGDQNNTAAPNSGAAYVFVRDGTTWTQQAYLKASNTGLQDNFGISVSISGDTIVVGASEEDSKAIGVNGDQSNDDARNSGAAYVFVRDGTTWAQQAYLKASNTGAHDSFGWSVSISGDTIVVGAMNEGSSAIGVIGDQNNDVASKSGAAYVFVRDGTTWTQQTYLKASNAGPDDAFGFSVSISGDTIVVGAFSEDSNAIGVNGDQNNNAALDSGAAYVFVRDGTTWTQLAYLKANNTREMQRFGCSVAVDEYIVAGQIGGDTASVFQVTNATRTTGASDESQIEGSDDNASVIALIVGVVLVVSAIAAVVIGLLLFRGKRNNGHKASDSGSISLTSLSKE